MYKKIIGVIGSFLAGALTCYMLWTCHAFPHFPEKYKSPALFTAQQHIERLKAKGKFAEVAPKTLLICCDEGLLKQITAAHKNHACPGYFGDFYFFTEHPSVAITRFGITSPLNAMGLEQAIAWGIKQIIFIGTAASMQATISVGDLIVVEKSVRDEGASHHYLSCSDDYAYASPSFTAKLVALLKEMNKPYKEGTIWTSDGFYRTTREEIDYFKKHGVLGTEMETAGLFSVATYHKIPMIAMLTVTDSFAKPAYEKPQDYKTAKMNAFMEFVAIALKLAAQE